MITIVDDMTLWRESVQAIARQKGRNGTTTRLLFADNAIHTARWFYGQTVVMGWISEVLVKVGGKDGDTQWRVK